MSDERQSSGVGKWLAGIIAAIIVGVSVPIILSLVNPEPGPDPPTKATSTSGDGESQDESTPAEAIAGSWSLATWREAPSDVTIGMEPMSGSLEASEDGSLTWTLDIDDLYWDDSGQPQASVTCDGQISLDATVSGSVADEANYSSNMVSASRSIAEAFCGGGVGAEDSSFAAAYSPDTDATTLEMSNSLGTFTWQR